MAKAALQAQAARGGLRTHNPEMVVMHADSLQCQSGHSTLGCLMCQLKGVARGRGPHLDALVQSEVGICGRFLPFLGSLRTVAHPRLFQCCHIILCCSFRRPLHCDIPHGKVSNARVYGSGHIMAWCQALLTRRDGTTGSRQ